MALLGPSADLAEGRSATRAGQTRQAATLLRRAVEGFDRLGAAWEGAQAREALAMVDVDRAGELRAMARATYVGLGARVDLERPGT